MIMLKRIIPDGDDNENILNLVEYLKHSTTNERYR